MINSLKTLVSSANIPFISGGGNSHVSNHLQHRPRMATVALLLLTFSFFNITSARAEKLCQSNYTGEIGALGAKTVKVSVGTIGTNMYRVVFESDFAMTGSLTYVNTSVNNNLCLDNTTKTILDGGKRIFFDMPSTSAPVFKNDIQVKTSEGNYTLTGTDVNSVDWSQTTAECSALVGNDCSGRSTEKSDGGNDFTNGYEYDFSSDGSGNVNISVTFLDTPDGMVNPQLYTLNSAGGEIGPNPSMTWNSSTHTASHTLTRQKGTIYFKVRVPYSGGVFVTKKFTIKVGAPCDSDYPSPEPGGETLDCEGHTFYFANNYWKFATPTAHLYNSGNGHTTTLPGYKMTQVSGTAGIYSVTYDNDPYADDYEKVIFSNNGTDKLGGKDISDCKYYDNDGDVHDNLSDVARHIYFVRNGSATSWNPPHARLYYETRNNGDAGAAMANTGLSNIDSHDLFSIIVPIYNNVGFKESSSYTNASAYSYIDNSFQDYSIFNYEHNTWYQTQNIYLTGSMNSWATDNASYKFSDWDRTSSTYVTLLTPPLTASTTYDFKVITGGVDRGLNADNTYSANNQTKRLYQGGAQEANVHLTTDVAGRYLFRYDVSAGKLTIFFPPSMLTANLDSRSITSAVLNVTSTRGTQYHVVDSSNGIDQVLKPTANQITVTGLTEGTLYTFTVTALDDNNTESSNSITLDPFCTLLETAPTAPTYDECQVLSVYSQYYRSLQASFSHWESGSTKTDRVVGGVNMWEVNVGTAWIDGGYGIEWGNQTFDISGYTGLHFDVWTPTATTIYVTPINRNATYDGNDPEVRHSGKATTARTWTSVNIPISEFTGAKNRNYQLKIEGNKGTPMFITNIFYYNKNADCTAPTVTTADVSAIVENNKLQLTLLADDGSKVFRITDREGNVYVKTADESNHVVMDNITYTYCTNYTFSVQAMDDAANLSEVVGCSGSVAPAVDFDLMDIPEGGVTARASVSAGDGWAAGKAIDSDDNTYWATGANFGEQWLAVNLTRIFGISSIKVAWNNANVSNLYIEGSRDGSNYYVLKHVTTAPATYSPANAAIAYETYTLDSHIQVRHIRLRAVGLNAEMAVRDIQIFGSCADDYAWPVMTEGVLKDVTINASLATATVTVNAYDETTQPASLTYKVVFSTGGLEDRTGLTVTDGMITLTGLTVGTSYTVQIYAVDESGNVSENYKEVSFTPYINLYYFTSDGTDVSGVWATVITDPESAAKRRFEATEHSGIYYYQIKAPEEGNVEYRLYFDESGAQVSEVANYWSGSDNQLVSGHNGETIEVFAKDKNHFVSIFDELKVYGSAVFADTEGSAFTMAYAGNHKFVWQGRVQEGTFRIIVNNNHSGLTDNSRVRIMNDDSFENLSAWTHAKLTFDMETWTWSWEEIDSEEFCEYSGAEGSGIVGLNGSRALQSNETYELFAYMSGNNWVVEMAFPTGAGRVYLQPFNAASGTDRTQFEMPPLGGNLYSVSLTPEQIATLYTADGIVRYTVKIEVAGGSDICQTEIHYFDLSNGVCAPDYFDIYHWDDASEGKRTSYNGGIIMQPIRYFRHFEHTDWCAIAFPFEVSRVAVYDNNDSREYDLYPRFYNGTKDVEGYYWLKTFPDWDNTPVSIANFKGTWQQLTYNTDKTGATADEEADLATHVLPSKNVPYVISFTDGSYYGTNWVIFYGEGGQTIASEADGQCENSITGSEEVVKLQRNNMMKPTETKSNIYMLEEGYDIYARYTQPIPAFESYVVGTSSVQTKYRIIRLRGETTPDTGTTTGLEDVPTTAGWKGDIYSVSGAKVATFASRDTMEHYLESLSPGIYVIRTASQILKIVVP